jgi:protein O-GlcNAc transferase
MKHCRHGPRPAELSLLDGVFLAARASILHQHLAVRFDPHLSFHSYDFDFCRSAMNAGFSLGIWSIPLIHKSGGNTSSTSWRNALQFY